MLKLKSQTATDIGEEIKKDWS